MYMGFSYSIMETASFGFGRNSIYKRGVKCERYYHPTEATHFLPQGGLSGSTDMGTLGSVGKRSLNALLSDAETLGFMPLTFPTSYLSGGTTSVFLPEIHCSRKA